MQHTTQWLWPELCLVSLIFQFLQASVDDARDETTQLCKLRTCCSFGKAFVLQGGRTIFATSKSSGVERLCMFLYGFCFYIGSNVTFLREIVLTTIIVVRTLESFCYVACERWNWFVLRPTTLSSMFWLRSIGAMVSRVAHGVVISHYVVFAFVSSLSL